MTLEYPIFHYMKYTHTTDKEVLYWTLKNLRTKRNHSCTNQVIFLLHDNKIGCQLRILSNLAIIRENIGDYHFILTLSFRGRIRIHFQSATN